MAIDLKFDLVGNPEPPTIILANRNGNRLGQLQVDEKSIDLSDKFNDASEFSFILNKYVDGKLTNLWDKVTNFKLVYCKEWNMFFEIKVELDEATETVKTVFCTQLGQAELSQIMLYNIEINTEADIERDSYKISILYNAFDTEASILHRILKDKAPHYSVIHVDSTIAKIQRSFSFDGTSIYDAFQEIAEEIGCLFVLHSNSKDGKIQRTISVYDLEQNCNDCNYRGEFTDVCPKCGSDDIKYGYGEDTTIFVTSDELASSGIQLTTDTDSVKNCFKLEAGDYLMTATIRNCNPNGTDYIWYFSDSTKEDMTDELVDKIESYDELYRYYQDEYVSDINTDLLNKYNALVDKYSIYEKELNKIVAPIQGYSSLMNAYYNVIDLSLYLESGLMPSVEMSDTSASGQARLLTSSSISPIAVTDVNIASLATVNSAILSMAKTIIRPIYKIQVNDSELVNVGSSVSWRGNFVVTNYSDEEDTATSSIISVTVSDDVETFVKQKIDKLLNKENTDDLSITGLFKMEYSKFCDELKKYALNPLTSFNDACQSCIDILIEQGIGNSSTWSDSSVGDNLYEKLYVPYYNKLKAIESEIKLREDELSVITGVYDLDGTLSKDGLQPNLEKSRDFIQDTLNFEKYLGNELWLEFCSYRREDKYLNENYISDGLDNAELFEKAQEFYDVAEKEIYKSAELQHSISTTLNNLLAIPKFKSLVESFSVGNWIRVQIDDSVYRLRLLEYEIDFGNFDNISVEFSDVTKIKNGYSDIESVLSKASSMATSYSSVQKQASQGEKSNLTLGEWVSKGLDATNIKIMGGADNQSQTWDSHGMLFREYDSISDTYHDEQLKIINSTIAITDDNWQSTKTAIGKHYYFDPSDKKLKLGYGVNAEVLVGKLILGEQLGLYNNSGSMSFDDNGLEITNGTNSFKVNPNSDVLVSISNKDQDVFYIDSNGKLHIHVEGDGLDISATKDILDLKAEIAQLKIDSGEISMMVKKDEIINSINMSTEGIRIDASKLTIDASDIEIDASNIKLEGVVTANENFKVLQDGSIEATNAKLSGYIDADMGRIGLWRILEEDDGSGITNFNRGALIAESSAYITALNVPSDIRPEDYHVLSVYKKDEDNDVSQVVFHIGGNGVLYTKSTINASGVIRANGGLLVGDISPKEYIIKSIQNGQIYLNSTTAKNVSFVNSMDLTPIVILTPVTTVSGICAGKIRSVDNTGFSAIIGGDGWGDTLFNWIAFEMSQ